VIERIGKMAKRKSSSNDLKFEIVQGPEMTEEDLDAIAQILARMIYDQITKEQKTQMYNPENDSSQEIVK
jgi:wyosine [tRNA(Phe)-imidazoG37] synthetase (radical SAM superfamily)